MSDAEDQRLIDSYRAGGDELPPPALDRAILESARQAVVAPPAGKPQSFNRARWMRPLALAASVVLGLGLVIRVQMERPDMAPEEAKKDVAMQAAPSAAPAPAAAPPPVAAPAPAAAEPAAPEADKERKAQVASAIPAPKLKQAPDLARVPGEEKAKGELRAREAETASAADNLAGGRRDQAARSYKPQAKVEPSKPAAQANAAEARDKSVTADSNIAAPLAKKEKDAVLADASPAKTAPAGAGGLFSRLPGAEAGAPAASPPASPPAAPPPPPAIASVAPMPAPRAAAPAAAPAQPGGGPADAKVADAASPRYESQAATGAAQSRARISGGVRALDESNPDNWARRIAELRRAGRTADADAELKRLRERYPDFKLPADALPPVAAPATP